MRIAQVTGGSHEVSASTAGIVERMVFVLTEQLVRRGHEITLFGSGDSETAARLVPVCQRRLRDTKVTRDLSAMMQLFALEKALAQFHQFDVIHLHTGMYALPVMRRSPKPILATLHGELEGPEVVEVYDEFKDLCFVATSVKQVRTLPYLNWQATISSVITCHDESIIENMVVEYLRVYERMCMATCL